VEKSSRSKKIEEPEIKKLQRVVKQVREDNSSTARNISKIVLSLQKKLSSHDKVLEKVLFTNECVDEKLCDLIHAIASNTFLNMYYPQKEKKNESKGS
jgi:hypothetical protein